MVTSSECNCRVQNFVPEEEESLGLSSSLPTLVNFSSIVVDLTLEDYTRVIDSGFCTSTADCYVTFAAAFAADTSGFPVIPITDGNAAEAVSLLEDRTPPVLIQFANFDFDEGQLLLNFSEEVRVSSFNLTALSLRQSFEPTSDGVTLSGGSVQMKR